MVMMMMMILTVIVDKLTNSLRLQLSVSIFDCCIVKVLVRLLYDSLLLICVGTDDQQDAFLIDVKTCREQDTGVPI
jgi:hypothetical protein